MLVIMTAACWWRQVLYLSTADMHVGDNDSCLFSWRQQVLNGSLHEYLSNSVKSSVINNAIGRPARIDQRRACWERVRIQSRVKGSTDRTR